MHKQYGLAIYRLVIGYLALAAVITQFIVGLRHNNLNLTNFFSYFTIESNILAACIFIVMGKATLLKIELKQRILLRGAAVLYMTITGIVYALLLSGVDVRLGITLPWVNTMLHYIMPVAVLLDWFIDPPARRISFKAALAWIVFPVIYLGYSLVRGSITGWYPYPFLNPANRGYFGVAVVALGILIVSLGLIWVILRVRAPAKEQKGTRSKR